MSERMWRRRDGRLQRNPGYEENWRRHISNGFNSFYFSFKHLRQRLVSHPAPLRFKVRIPNSRSCAFMPDRKKSYWFSTTADRKKSLELLAHVEETHVPTDILTSIFSKLSLLDLARARCVCKEWNLMLSSFKFLRKLKAVFHKPCLVMSHVLDRSIGLVFFDMDSCQWFRVPMPLCRLLSGYQLLVAAAEGLFCFADRSGWGWHSYLLTICNPLLGQWENLPRMPVRGSVVALTVDVGTGAYRVHVIAEANYMAVNILLAEVYDSSTKKWTVRSFYMADGPVDADAPPTPISGGAILRCDGTWITYDIYQNSWTMLDLTTQPAGTWFYDDVFDNIATSLPRVVDCDGRFFLVARIDPEDVELQVKFGQLLPLIWHGPVGLWQSDDDNKGWSLVSKVPDKALEEMVASSDGSDFIVTSNASDSIFLILAGSSKMIVYDLHHTEWKVLPGCPGDEILCRRNAVFSTLGFLPVKGKVV